MKKYVGWCLLAALCAPVLAGCGSGEYGKRLEARISQVKKGSAFQAMQAPTMVSTAGVSLQVRLPKQFDSPPLQQAAETDEKRIGPPGYTLQGLASTYEGIVVDSTGGKIAYYCYLGAEELRPQTADRVEGSIRLRLERTFPGAEVQWQSVDAHTETGSSVAWRKTRINANQEFYYVDPDGKSSFRPMDGFLEIWIRKEGNKLLKVAWRVPSSIAPNVEIDKWAPRVAGTAVLGAENDGG